MNAKKIGWIVILVSVGAGVLFGMMDQVFRGGIRALTLAWPALGIVVGALTVAGVKVTDMLQLSDEVEALPELVADDVQDLRSGRLSPPLFYAALTLVGILFYAFVLVRYQKWHATWGKTNVLLVALLATAVMAFLAIRSFWFQRRRWRFPARVFVIPALGFAATLYIGVHWAEPVEFGGMTQLERSQVVTSDGYWAYTRSGGGIVYADAAAEAALDVADVSFRFIDFGALLDIDCDDEACLVLFLVVILVVLVAVLLVASATVPHFWVVASTLLLMIMALVTVRELLHHPDQYNDAAG